MTPLPPGVEALRCGAIHTEQSGKVEQWPVQYRNALEGAHAAGARAGFLAGLEAAAKVCTESSAIRWNKFLSGESQPTDALLDAAAAIRALGETK